MGLTSLSRSLAASILFSLSQNSSSILQNNSAKYSTGSLKVKQKDTYMTASANS